MRNGLGPDLDICMQEFVEAMRRHVQATDPDSAGNMDLPEVQQNFSPFGDAVFQIATTHAQTHSSADDDPDFWAWAEALGNWAASMSAWQQGLVSAFEDWAPNETDEQTLRSAVLSIPDPGEPPANTPEEVQGRIQ